MSFDSLAPHYRWMEWLLAGERLQRCRTEFLGQIEKPRQVLIVGEGNGRFLVECCRAFPSAQFTCVDASRGMLRVAQERVTRNIANPPQIDFQHGNALEFTFEPERFDLIVTHFFLDCFSPEELRAVIKRLSLAARSRCEWLLADFRVPPRGAARLRALAVHRLMFLFFRWATDISSREVTSPNEMLMENGFVLERRKLSCWGSLHTDWWHRGNSRVTR